MPVNQERSVGKTVGSPGVFDVLKAIVGTWTLVSYKHESFEGIVFYPMGPYAQGRLIYTETGFFSVVIMQPNRRQFVAENLFEASAEEKLQAADGFIAYSGQYTVQDNKILHTVDLSFFPNWIGSKHLSTAFLNNDMLLLATPSLSPTAVTPDIAHIQWKRADPL
jgi:hypothetical protein